MFQKFSETYVHRPLHCSGTYVGVCYRVRRFFMEINSACRYRYNVPGGVYRDWPEGRGIFFNDTKTFLVWVNEEDHFRLISMEKGGNLGRTYKRLVTVSHLGQHVIGSVGSLYMDISVGSLINESINASGCVVIPDSGANRCKVIHIARVTFTRV